MDSAEMSTMKFICHSEKVLRIALEYGWLPGACYTNLRNVKKFDTVGFIDINWKNYSFRHHLSAVKSTQPYLTVAQDITDINALDEIIEQAMELSLYARRVIVVPKDIELVDIMESAIPLCFLFGYSVPTKYGKTEIPPETFRRPVHLLGGRPDVQRALAERVNVFSLDCNRFTLDASYGDYFAGDKFVPHPTGGYENCIRESLSRINMMWDNDVQKGVDCSAKGHKLA